MYTRYAEELSEEVEGGGFLVSEEVIEGVDEVSPSGIEDMVEYFFVVIAYDLSNYRDSRILKSQSRYRRGRGTGRTSARILIGR